MTLIGCMGLAFVRSHEQSCKSVPRSAERSGVWAVGLLLLALLPFGSPPVRAQATPQANVTAARPGMVLDQFSAQNQLRKARLIFLIEEDNEVVLRFIAAELEKRVRSGVGRGLDLATAKAALAESTIAVQEASGMLGAARFRYEARHGDDVQRIQEHVPVWGDRMPASERAMVQSVAESDQLSARQAWLRMQRAQAVRSLHKDRVKNLETVQDVVWQQFNIGQKGVVELIQAQFTLRDAKVASQSAEHEALQAQAAVMALSGGLKTSDLLLQAPASSTAAEPWLFDPDAPEREAVRRQRSENPPPRTQPVPVVRAAPPPPSVVGAPRPVPKPSSAQHQIKPEPGKEAANALDDVVLETAAAGSVPEPVRAIRGRSPASTASPSADDDSLPSLPWPPAPASAEEEIPSGLLRPSTGAPTLGFAAKLLQAALMGADYSTFSYLAVPNGFAIVSRMEQIKPDGKPTTPRWERAIHVPSLAEAGLTGLIESLYQAPVGRYRVIMFVVTDAPRDRAGQAMGEAAMDKLLHAGKSQLPTVIADMPYTPRTKAVALIYEFAKSGDKQVAQFVVTSRLSGDEHLEKAGVTKALKIAVTAN